MRFSFRKKQTARSEARLAAERRERRAAPVVGRIAITLLAVAVCAVPPIFVNNIIGYLPLLAVVLAILISFVYLQVLRRSFSFSEDSLVSSCERGSEIDFVLHFRNASPLVVLRLEPRIYVSDLFGEADDITAVPLTLMPHEDREFRFQASFDHIGTYSAGVRTVTIGDLLGLFSYTIENEKRHRVEVLPRLFSADDVPLSSEVSSESQKPRQALTVDDMDYAGVREYAWGDPIKTIHWKLSARNPSGEYLTRLFETFNNPGVATILDTSAPNYDRESLMFVFDGIVETALSVNQFALSQGIDSVIEFRNRAGEDAKLRLMKNSDFPELTHALPRIATGDGHEARELLRREMASLHGQDNVAVCTSQVNEELISMLITLRLRKRNPMLFLIVPPSLDSDEVRAYAKPLRRLDEAQIPHYILSSAADLGAKREG